MKTIILLLILCSSIASLAQTKSTDTRWIGEQFGNPELYPKDYKSSFMHYDYSPLLKGLYSLGFIGPHFQRLQLYFDTVSRRTGSRDLYEVTGKSKVGNNICDFTGTIKILHVRLFKDMHWGVDDEYKGKGIQKEGAVVGEYLLSERRSENNSGRFQGEFVSWWFINKQGQVKYDTIEADCSDNYRNNQFAGTWTRYGSRRSEVANWGDSRIPQSGDLDIGAAYFSPDPKYFEYGWKNYSEAINSDNKDAQKKEAMQWWKH